MQSGVSNKTHTRMFHLHDKMEPDADAVEVPGMIGRILCFIGLHDYRADIDLRPCMHGMKTGWERVPVLRCRRCNLNHQIVPEGT